jgi:hypothetical protein
MLFETVILVRPMTLEHKSVHLRLTMRVNALEHKTTGVGMTLNARVCAVKSENSLVETMVLERKCIQLRLSLVAKAFRDRE